MDIKNELIYDFSLNLPRVLVSGKTGILDNVKRIVMVSEKTIIIDNGQRFTALNGEGLTINRIEDERMLIVGEIKSIEFFGALPADKG
ncbi:YabP/YqfC family sporulation protein [Clostridium aminobutyricum]|uniref:YabP/YqfC family sporulation protein n=1 Tax=Clostridium aminobutyricum TaxID=33953 RepID=A0A939D776_CLOAM|nr:YabP/YqfC family sporulation protein [Clostridium aminobutyricum]MBN7772699.1 YabP/YqfC family sporulation protein [Clostridium aminobutyricum]